MFLEGALGLADIIGWNQSLYKPLYHISAPRPGPRQWLVNGLSVACQSTSENHPYL